MKKHELITYYPIYTTIFPYYKCKNCGVIVSKDTETNVIFISVENKCSFQHLNLNEIDCDEYIIGNIL